jgi:TolB protein
MNSDGSGKRSLSTIGGEPQWSPDGKRIGFDASTSNNSDIWTMNADGSGKTRVTTAASSEFNPQWNGAGTRIFFLSNRNGGVGIYSVRSSAPYGKAVTVLRPQQGALSGLAASASGAIAFWYDATPGDGESEIDLAVGGVRSTLLTCACFGGPMDWSPQSRTLAFTMGGSFGDDYENSDIATINPDGTGLRIVPGPTSGYGYYNFDPSWSPTGSWLVLNENYSAVDYHPMGIWKVHPNGTNATQLSKDGTEPDWQPVL